MELDWPEESLWKRSGHVTKPQNALRSLQEEPWFPELLSFLWEHPSLQMMSYWGKGSIFPPV